MNRTISTLVLAGALVLGATLIAPAAFADTPESPVLCGHAGAGSLDATNMGYNPEGDNVSFNAELDGPDDNLALTAIDPQLESSNVSFNPETGAVAAPIFIYCRP